MRLVLNYEDLEILNYLKLHNYNCTGMEQCPGAESQCLCEGL